MNNFRLVIASFVLAISPSLSFADSIKNPSDSSVEIEKYCEGPEYSTNYDTLQEVVTYTFVQIGIDVRTGAELWRKEGPYFRGKVSKYHPNFASEFARVEANALRKCEARLGQ